MRNNIWQSEDKNIYFKQNFKMDSIKENRKHPEEKKKNRKEEQKEAEPSENHNQILKKISAPNLGDVLEQDPELPDSESGTENSTCQATDDQYPPQIDESEIWNETEHVFDDIFTKLDQSFIDDGQINKDNIDLFNEFILNNVIYFCNLCKLMFGIEE